MDYFGIIYSKTMKGQCICIEAILKNVPIKEIAQNFKEDEESSKVTAWSGKLDIRPEYQREFVYDEKKCEAVIETVLSNLPIEIMYFVDREDGNYEVLDGQQRLISICRYLYNKFSIKASSDYSVVTLSTVKYEHLHEKDKSAIDNYKLPVYICRGTEDEKISWFKTINIAGEKLENQEILNAVFHGDLLTDAKRYFSREDCRAHSFYGTYLEGSCIKQKYLETVLSWAANKEGLTGKHSVEEYMKKHKWDKNAKPLWDYCENIFNWVENLFGKRTDGTMKGVEWGVLYNKYKDNSLNSEKLKLELDDLLKNDEIRNKSGIYEYLLAGNEKVLNLRCFSSADKITLYNRQRGMCAVCRKEFQIKDMEADHIVPWSKGGRTELNNGQMLCKKCNREKSNMNF